MHKVEIPLQDQNPMKVPGACSTCFKWHENLEQRAECCREKRCQKVVFQYGKRVICNRDAEDHEHRATACCGKKEHAFKPFEACTLRKVDK